MKQKQVRVRVIELHKKGMKPKDIASKAKCSIAYVYNVVADYKRLNVIQKMNDKADTQYKVHMLTSGASAKRLVKSSSSDDKVNHPVHYKAGGIETIDFIEAKKLDYHLGNVVKYITRSDLKGNKLEDLQKAQWYLNRAISNLTK
jgi:hypothetical protein